MITRSLNWKFLCKVYVATASPARSESSSYVAWGHSSAVSPWGEVIASTDEKESVVYADIGVVKSMFYMAQLPDFKGVK
jgi:omega-amidase